MSINEHLSEYSFKNYTFLAKCFVTPTFLYKMGIFHYIVGLSNDTRYRTSDKQNFIQFNERYYNMI